MSVADPLLTHNTTLVEKKLHIPIEILLMVADSYCNQSSRYNLKALKNLRLVCRAANKYITPWIFETIVIPDNFDLALQRLRDLTNSECLSHVKQLFFQIGILAHNYRDEIGLPYIDDVLELAVGRFQERAERMQNPLISFFNACPRTIMRMVIRTSKERHVCISTELEEVLLKRFCWIPKLGSDLHDHQMRSHNKQILSKKGKGISRDRSLQENTASPCCSLVDIYIHQVTSFHIYSVEPDIDNRCYGFPENFVESKKVVRWAVDCSGHRMYMTTLGFLLRMPDARRLTSLSLTYFDLTKDCFLDLFQETKMLESLKLCEIRLDSPSPHEAIWNDIFTLLSSYNFLSNIEVKLLTYYRFKPPRADRTSPKARPLLVPFQADYDAFESLVRGIINRRLTNGNNNTRRMEDLLCPEYLCPLPRKF